VYASILAVLLSLLLVLPAQSQGWKVLAFTRTTGFRHDSIPDALAAVQRLGEANGFTVDATEDPSTFTDATLANYAAVVFLLTTGDVLDPSGRAAFERYIRGGGGYVGVHSAADTEYDWAWYGDLMGAYFASHPEIQPASVVVETDGSLWPRIDEWYNFRRDPRSSVDVLLRLDENSYGGGQMGEDHPIAWYHAFDGGRAWYTGMGHTRESYTEPAFLRHLLGGIQYAAGVSQQPDAR
jgi:cytochrome c